MINSLNSPQIKAVETTNGPLLVLAGAGTGKTRVLTSRIIHIVNSYQASPLQILAVTFTNKAAAEMKKRIGETIGDQVNNLWVGTFHSIAARILRRHPEVVGLRSDFTIIDDDDQTRLLKQILSDFGIDNKQFPPKIYLNKISRLKDKVVSPVNLNFEVTDTGSPYLGGSSERASGAMGVHNTRSTYLGGSSERASGAMGVHNTRSPLFEGDRADALAQRWGLPKLKEVYETYQFRLKSMNAADFGDLLLHNLEIFRAAPDVLAYYQDKFRYILVDEYQDTNNAQYQWLLKLADTHKNICCVGDDDQSIYSWRGANIANILRFEKDFKDAKVIRLEQNYRSTSRILEAAHSVISNNKERHGKKLWTDKGQGEKVKLISYPDDRSEASSTSQMIKIATAAQKYKAQEIAVLVRAGYQTRAFEEAFIHSSIPYKVIGGMKFYERLEIRDAIAYMRICANISDDLALNRIINVPKRGVGDAAISGIYDRSKVEGIPFFSAIKKSLEENSLKGKAREALKDLVEKIEKVNSKINDENLSDLARSLLTDVGYIAMWKNENTLEAQGRIENIEEFINSLTEFSSMTEFLEYVSLIEAREDKNLVNAVTIMTVHAAKGLEFDLVFVPGLEDGLFPSAKSVEERNGLEEERRLMYVAITRAKKELILSHAKTRYIFGDLQMQIPSRFLKELPQDDIEIEDANFGSTNSWNQRSNFKNNYQERNLINSSFSVDMSLSVNRFKDSSDGISGKRVFHQKFGYGKVLSVDGNRLEISFEKTGIKTVMKDFISLA